MQTLYGFEIDVDREKLIEILESNLEKHSSEYQAAKARYRQACKDALEERLAEVDSLAPNKILWFLLHSDYPKDYSKVYKEVLEMLRIHEGGTISITAEQHKAWVKDEWDWKRDFQTKISKY